MRRTGVSIIGYYTSNLGDLLMLKGLMDQLPDNVKKVYILTYGTFLLSLNQFPDLDIVVVDLTSVSSQWQLLLDALIHSKVIIWAGGTCFNDAENSYGGLRYMKLFHLFGAKVVYLGVGVNTDSASKRLSRNLKKAIGLSVCFTVRDTISKDYILSNDLSYSIAVTPDLIFLNDFPKPYHNDKKKLLSVSYRCVDGYFREADCYREQMVKNIIAFVNNKKISEIKVFPSDKEVDTADNIFIAQELKEKLPQTEVSFFLGELDDYLKILSMSSYVFTGRLHVAVVSSIFGVPFQLLNYSSKNRALVVDAGLSPRCLVNYCDLVHPDLLYENVSSIEKTERDYKMQSPDVIVLKETFAKVFN